MGEQVVNNLKWLRYITQDTLDPSHVRNGFSTEADARTWRDRSCGIACVSMVLFATLQETPSLAFLIREGIERNAYIADVGWSHYGLSHMLTDRGLKAEVRNFGNIDALTELLQIGRSLILSVGPGLTGYAEDGERGRRGHLILVHGLVYNETLPTHFVISDPDYKEKSKKFSFRCRIDEVTSFSSLRCIVV